MTIFLYFGQHGWCLWWERNYMQLILDLIKSLHDTSLRSTYARERYPSKPLISDKNRPMASGNILSATWLWSKPLNLESLPAQHLVALFFLFWDSQHRTCASQHRLTTAPISVRHLVSALNKQPDTAIWQGFIGSGDKGDENSCCKKSDKPH